MIRRLGIALAILAMACGYALAQPLTRPCTTNSAGTACVPVTASAPGTTSSAQIFNDADGTCSSGLIATVSTVALATLTFNAAATIGICVKTAGAGAADITILWR